MTPKPEIPKTHAKKNMCVTGLRSNNNEKSKCTKYLSVATETRIASSPNRTFSPSERCFDDG